LDATTLGGLLTGGAAVIGAVVVFVGKRGENKNSLTDQLQEELTVKRTDLAAAEAEVKVLQRQHHDDLIRMTQLEIQIIRLGGPPNP
jgi:hypothetical protein